MNQSLYDIQAAYLKLLEADSPAGSMSSGGYLQQTLDDPKHGIYTPVAFVFNPKTKEKKEMKDEKELRSFLRENPEWNILLYNDQSGLLKEYLMRDEK